MTLNLATCKYKGPELGPKYKKNKETGEKTEVERSPEEKFLLNHIPPATEGAFIKNEYFLMVKLKYDSNFDCCSEHPTALVPLTIIPLGDPSVYGFPEPPGFAPFDLGYFRFELREGAYKVEVD